MNRVLPVLSLALVATSACGTPPPTELASSTRTLAGETAAGDGEVFDVLLSPDGVVSGMCAATRIGRRTLVTAAHCASGLSAGDLRATNVVNVAEAAPADLQAIERVAIHPDWDPSSLEGDLALLLLAEAPPGPAKPLRRTPLGSSTIGESVRVVGYGATGPYADDAGLRRTGEAIVDSFETRTVLLLGAKVPCVGDSGGAVFLPGPEGGAEQLVGFISTGSEDCTQSSATRVDAYLPFLDDWLAANDPEPSCDEDGTCVTDCPTPDPDCEGGGGGSGGVGGTGGDGGMGGVAGAGGNVSPSPGGGRGGGCSSTGSGAQAAGLLGVGLVLVYRRPRRPAPPGIDRRAILP